MLASNVWQCCCMVSFNSIVSPACFRTSFRRFFSHWLCADFYKAVLVPANSSHSCSDVRSHCIM